MATKHNVEEAIARAYIIKRNNPHYSMDNRGYGLDKPYYDCSSFIGSCWEVAVGTWAPNTPNMVRYYTQQGFTHLAYDPQILQRGDILVWNKPGTPGSGGDGHTAMYLGDGDYVIQCSLSANGVTDTGTISNSLPPGYVWQDILRGDSRVKIINVTLITP